MTIERVRQIYGDEFSHLSDQEILIFIGDMSIICDELLKDSISQLTLKDKNKNINVE